MTSEELAAALELCNSEPVHTPGLIQPCGTVLAYDLSTRHISHISSNIAEVLGVEREARAFLGQPLEVLFDGDMRHALRNCEARPASELRRDYVGRYYLGQKDFDLYGFRSDGHMVLELEAADGADMDAAALSTRLSDLNDACSHADSEAALWQQLVRVLQQVSGYDRVLAYRFDADFNGEVIAEACRRSMVPLLGLRFPHWDIPPQARAIMAKTPLRFIADVDLEPAAVLAAGPDLPPLDISLGHLRGVSPVHLQYLRNLGSQATLTLSVVLDGRLWGMLSFHHRKPRVPSLALRHLLTSFLPNMQTRLEVLARKRDLDIASRVQTLREQAHAALSAPGTADLAFSELAPLILADLKADGVVLRVGGETYALGDVPPPRVVSVLVGQALRDETGPLALHQLDDALRQHADGPAGALVVAYGRDRAMAVFRNPVSQEVAWAGAPQKELDHSDGTLRLSPRGSFDTYLELVEGQSIRWSAFECQLAPALTQSFLSAFEFRAAAQAFGEQQFLMLNELNHRVKNILALMRWMAKGGRRDNKTLSSYADALQNRIITVARAFDQGAGSGDRWVALNGLLQAEFTADEAVSLPQTGLDIRASAAPLLAMVLHELASNARTHGALSEAGDVILGVVARDSHYRLLWQEMGGPAVASAGEIIEGFGLTLIRQAIPFELGGQAEVAFMASGLRAVLDLPKDLLRASEPHPDRKADDDGRETSDSGAEDGPDRLVPSQTVRTADRVQPQVHELPEGLRAPGAVCLLVEDNFVISLAVEASLRDAGCPEVVAHSNVAGAMSFLQERRPAFACLDINLGAHQGSSVPVADLLVAMKVPFVFVTGYGELNQLPPRLAEVPILAKPFSDADLVAALAAAARGTL